MKCALCEKEIENYDARFNHLELDETHSYNICEKCQEKLIEWQGRKIAKLFPTKTLKNRFGK